MVVVVAVGCCVLFEAVVVVDGEVCLCVGVGGAGGAGEGWRVASLKFGAVRRSGKRRRTNLPPFILSVWSKTRCALPRLP